MDKPDQLEGHVAKLPDGQTVRIETVYDDGYALVKRVEGPRLGQIAVCLISKLSDLTGSDNLNAGSA
jgi:hypothetical protein